MGANCCIAARKKPASCQSPRSVDFGYSPSWSLNDAQAYSNDICYNPLFQTNSDSSALDNTNYVEANMNNPSGIQNFSCSLPSTNLKKTRSTPGADGDVFVIEEDQGMRTNALIMEKDLDSSSAGSISPNSVSLVPAHPSLSSSPYKSETLSPCSSYPSGLAASKKARRPSIGYRICKQISDSWITKSSREDNTAKKKKSYIPLDHSADFPMEESHGGSSDHWSLRIFSEMTASSRRERLSFGSETSSCDRPDCSLTPTKVQNCRICSKRLGERPAWSRGSSAIASNLPVVAVLFCGHVYHADCLENQTPEKEKYDPPCPVCTSAMKQASTSSRSLVSKARNKHSRAAVGDCDLDGSIDFDLQKRIEFEGKVSRRSSSLKSSFTRHFWRGHFSMGTSRLKKGAWAKISRK